MPQGELFKTPLDPRKVEQGWNRLMQQIRETTRLYRETTQKQEAALKTMEEMCRRLGRAAKETIVIPVQQDLPGQENDEPAPWEEGYTEPPPVRERKEMPAARFARIPDGEEYGVRLPPGERGEAGFAVQVVKKDGDSVERTLSELVQEGGGRRGELWTIVSDRRGGGKIDNSQPRFCKIGDDEWGVVVPKDWEVDEGSEVEVATKRGKTQTRTLGDFVEERNYGNVWSVRSSR